MSNHIESSNNISSSSSHFNAGSVSLTSPNSLSFSNHHAFGLNPHFAATTGLNRLFNGIDHPQAFLSFYHKSPISVKAAPTTDEENLSENEGSVSNGSNQDQSCQLSSSKKRQLSNDQVDNDELTNEELANIKSSSESN